MFVRPQSGHPFGNILPAFCQTAIHGLVWYVLIPRMTQLLDSSHTHRRQLCTTEKYALTLTAGIGSGVAIFGLLYFFIFQMNGQSYDWVSLTNLSPGSNPALLAQLPNN